MINSADFIKTNGYLLFISSHLNSQFGEHLSADIQYENNILTISPNGKYAVTKHNSSACICIRKLQRTVYFPEGRIMAEFIDGKIVADLSKPTMNFKEQTFATFAKMNNVFKINNTAVKMFGDYDYIDYSIVGDDIIIVPGDTHRFSLSSDNRSKSLFIPAKVARKMNIKRSYRSLIDVEDGKMVIHVGKEIT